MSVALVTGAAKGLGKEVSLELAKRGISLLIHYRNSLKEAEKVQFACEQLGVKAALVQADFSSDHNALKSLDVNYLVNNVGEYLLAPLSKTSPFQFQRLWRVNFFVPFDLIQTLPLTSVVNIGVAGLDLNAPFKTSPAYHITKRALLDLTRSFANAGSMRVNMVSPAFMENSLFFLKDTKPISLKVVAKTVVDVLLNEAMTGQNIEVE